MSTISSLSPCIIKPETGQGAKKLKSYEFAGGERGWIGDSPLVHLDTKKAILIGQEQHEEKQVS